TRQNTGADNTGQQRREQGRMSRHATMVRTKSSERKPPIASGWPAIKKAKMTPQRAANGHGI
ncbi:hypothetical protein, partial [Sphingopyxis sp.]|uniref:hypothetical protein n=1 Tax=Sphingopyxis sp. TaxID=1908224 RepID=UPI003D6D1BB7